MDSFGRTIDYLRISVTDRCNERCVYCLPEGYQGWAQRPDHLSAEEILRVVRVAARLGFRKFRLTGGEPLGRPDLVEIARNMAVVPGVECVRLSTNGTRLASLAVPLRAAGVRTVNISLDAMDAAVYRRVTGGDLDSVLAGVHAAVAAGYESIKLNCVLMRGINEDELWPLARFAAEHGLPLRLIELMPLTNTDVLDERNFFSAEEAMEVFRERDELIEQPDRRIGFGPARYYLLKRTGALIGFIGSITNQHFCESCNRVRLTADGKVRPCLGNHGEMDLRQLLREGADDTAIQQVLEEAILQKPREHTFRNCYQPGRPMTAIGG